MERKHDCIGLISAIDNAKTLGIQVSEATSLLTQWQTHGRQLILAAKAARVPSRIQEVLEETRGMGLAHLAEWKVCFVTFVAASSRQRICANCGLCLMTVLAMIRTTCCLSSLRLCM